MATGNQPKSRMVFSQEQFYVLNTSCFHLGVAPGRCATKIFISRNENKCSFDIHKHPRHETTWNALVGKHDSAVGDQTEMLRWRLS